MIQLNKLTLIAGVVGAALATSVNAASFDCRKAGTAIEKMICGDQRLSALDEALASSFKEAMRTNPGTARPAQLEWLKQRNACQDVACVAAAYQSRISDLRSSSLDPGSLTSMTGTYKSSGGSLLILQQGGQVQFTISAMSGMNEGELSGTATLARDTAIYTDKEKDCVLVMRFQGQNAVVNQQGGCGFGLNVTAAGDYSRLSTLPPKIDAPTPIASTAPAPKSTGAERNSPPPVPVTVGSRIISADDLYEDYRRNEVAADEKYKGKMLSVSGYIERIRKDLTGDMVVSLRTTSKVNRVSANMRESEKSNVASLAPGQVVVLRCQGAGMTISTPRLKGCQIAEARN
jgi:uncharacterized protein